MPGFQSYSIKLGIFDWGHFPATGSYYPDDLPEEWRLQFFSNEFDSACVSVGSWLEREDVFEQLEDIDDHFELSLLITSADQFARAEHWVSHAPVALRYLVRHADSAQGSDGHRDDLKVISENLIWNPEKNMDRSSPVACLPGSQSPRQYRDWLEQWLACEPQQSDLTVWLDARTTDYSTLQNCRQLLQLMGY